MSITEVRIFSIICNTHIHATEPCEQDESFLFLFNIFFMQSDTNPRASTYGRSKADPDRKIGHRRVGEGGEITYKKIQTTQIMGAIQLGIQHTVRIWYIDLIERASVTKFRPWCPCRWCCLKRPIKCILEISTDVFCHAICVSKSRLNYKFQCQIIL